MRMHFAVVGLALCACVSPVIAQLTNPSFEDGLNGWNLADGVLGTDFDVYTEGNPNPTAPDGTHFAGIIKSFGSETTEPALIWQTVSVPNPGNLPFINYDIQFDIACYANDTVSDANAMVEATLAWQNDGQLPDAMDPPRVMSISRFSHRFTGNDDDDEPFRRIKASGTLPDNPGTFILRFKFIHNPDMSQRNFALIDNVIFTAQPAGAALPLPTTNAVTNGDFETPPFNVTYNPEGDVHTIVMPAGWTRSVDVIFFEGPVEGFTNGVTSPTDPLGVSTTNGEHFYGVAKPDTLNTQPKMTMYQIIPVSGFNSCARGIRYRYHSIGHHSVTNNPAQYDHASTDVTIRWAPDGGDFGSPFAVSPWALIALPNVRYTDNAQTGMKPIDVSGEIETIDAAGNPIGVETVLLEVRVNTWRPQSEGHIYRTMIDDIQFEIEAITSEESPAIFTQAPLPDGACSTPYEFELDGCGVGEQTWTLDSGELPAGLDLGTDGVITGSPLVGGLFNFTVRLQDDEASVTHPLSMTVGGLCCNNPPADFDEDGDVDQDDFGLWQLCYTGSNNGIPEDCACMDLDRDGVDIDQADFTRFQLCSAGPERPAAETCE